jgi:hypothetical protein
MEGRRFHKGLSPNHDAVAKQRSLNNKGLGKGVCDVVDGVQGIETDTVVLDLGRDHGVGFLRDPRRINVAMTRARKRLFVIAHAGLGYYDFAGSGHNYWHRFRRVCSKLEVIRHVSLEEDARRVAESVFERMQQKPPLDRPRVFDVFQGHTGFFKEYMQTYASPLGQLGAVPDSDDDIAAEDARLRVRIDRQVTSRATAQATHGLVRLDRQGENDDLGESEHLKDHIALRHAEE